METTLYLIRHAQSQPSARIPHAEWPLSPVGLNQADRLGDLLEPLEIEVMFSSPYTRTMQTVQPYASRCDVEVVVKEDLREQTLFTMFVDDSDEYRELSRRSWAEFDFATPGCESSGEAQSRFVEAINDLLTEASDQSSIGVSTHGKVLGLFLNYLDQTFGKEQSLEIKNPDVVRIVASDRLLWDKQFQLQGLDAFATHDRSTREDSKS